MNIYMFCLDSYGANPLKYPKLCPKLTSYLNKSNLLFRNIIVSTPYTYGSIAAMFTGLYGTVNGVDNWINASKSFKKDEVITLPEILQRLGFKTCFVGFDRWEFVPTIFEKKFLMELVQDMSDRGKYRVGRSDTKYREENTKKFAEEINKIKGDKFVFFGNMNYHDFNRCANIDIPVTHWCDESSKYFAEGMKFMDDNMWIEYFDIDFEKDIVILFSDHGGRIWDDVYLDEAFVRCFWGIFAPKLKKRIVDKYYSTVDFLSVFLKIVGETDSDILQGNREGSEYCVSFGGIGDPKLSKFTSPDKPNQFLVTDGKYYYYRHESIGEMITQNWKDIRKIHNNKNNKSDNRKIEFYKNKMNDILYPKRTLREFYKDFKFKHS